MKNAIKMLVGSCLVYLACSSASPIAAKVGVTSHDGGTIDPSADASADTGDSGSATDGSRLKAIRFVGADGSGQFAGAWHDTQRDEDCTFQLAGDGAYRCLPSGVYGTMYSDSTCTTPAAPSTCTSGNYIINQTYDSCGTASGDHVWQKGQTLAVTRLWMKSGSSCAENDSVSGQTFTLGSSEVTADQFVQATRQ